MGFVTDGSQFDVEGSVPQQDDDRTLGLLVAVLVSKRLPERPDHSSFSFLSASRTASRGLFSPVKAVTVVTVLLNGTGPVHHGAWWTPMSVLGLRLITTSRSQAHDAYFVRRATMRKRLQTFRNSVRISLSLLRRNCTCTGSLPLCFSELTIPYSFRSEYRCSLMFEFRNSEHLLSGVANFGQNQVWPSCFTIFGQTIFGQHQLNQLGPNQVWPNQVRPTPYFSMMPRRVEAQKGGRPKPRKSGRGQNGGGPEGWGSKFRAFFEFPAPIFALFVSLWGSSREFCCF